MLIAPEGTGVRLVATDSYRLALRDIEGSDAFSGASQILVPARALGELQRLSALGTGTKGGESGPDGEDGSAPGPMVGLSIGEHDVTFTAGEVKVSTRLLDGTLSGLPPTDSGELSEPSACRQGLAPRRPPPGPPPRP